MESEPVSQQALSDRGGFTLLEMLAVIAVLAALFSVVMAHFDLTGHQTAHQLERFRTTIRSLHIRSLRSGRTLSLTVEPTPSITIQVNATDGRDRSFTLSNWRLKNPSEPFRIHVSPSGVQGPPELDFRSVSGRRKLLQRYRLEGYRVSDSS